MDDLDILVDRAIDLKLRDLISRDLSAHSMLLLMHPYDVQRLKRCSTFCMFAPVPGDDVHYRGVRVIETYAIGPDAWRVVA